ncbi:serine/arginine repetitive matrix protein 1-like [Ctenocephalides felis]|uniref:serine/arginine repetitive matrix protein 1-like n=1 Tax=Ctenocephalides felis TaxID=7515 RepID=UPI000E6E43FE|nr:serine/arginine repetitive matrix protein 1-like [Ctenocephalides felis]
MNGLILWMRSKSPGSRRPKERTSRRSYSSGSSYSSSSSTSSTKSRSPRSRSPRVRGTHHSSTSRRRARVSPSVIVSERRAASERALLMNPPAPSPRKRPHSPAMMRRHAQNPPAPISVSKSSSNSKSSKINREQTDAFGRVRRDIDRVSERSRRDSLTSSSKGSHKSPYKRDSRDSRRRDGRSASSNSGSSDSSSSDSGSSYSSSSSSRERSPVTSRRLVDSARLHATIDRSKVRARTPVDRKRDESRKAVESGRKRPASSPPSEDKSNKSPNGPKKASRREELLKQLKAVEDAIARKRSKND